MGDYNSFLTKGEEIKKEVELKSRRHLIFTNRRIIELGSNFFRDIDYKHVNSILCARSDNYYSAAIGFSLLMGGLLAYFQKMDTVAAFLIFVGLITIVYHLMSKHAVLKIRVGSGSQTYYFKGMSRADVAEISKIIREKDYISTTFQHFKSLNMYI